MSHYSRSVPFTPSYLDEDASFPDGSFGQYLQKVQEAEAQYTNGTHRNSALETPTQQAPTTNPSAEDLASNNLDTYQRYWINFDQPFSMERLILAMHKILVDSADDDNDNGTLYLQRVTHFASKVREVRYSLEKEEQKIVREFFEALHLKVDTLITFPPFVPAVPTIQSDPVESVSRTKKCVRKAKAKKVMIKEGTHGMALRRVKNPSSAARLRRSERLRNKRLSQTTSS